MQMLLSLLLPLAAEIAEQATSLSHSAHAKLETAPPLHALCRNATTCADCVSSSGCGWSLVRLSCFLAHPTATTSFLGGCGVGGVGSSAQLSAEEWLRRATELSDPGAAGFGPGSLREAYGALQQAAIAAGGGAAPPRGALLRDSPDQQEPLESSLLTSAASGKRESTCLSDHHESAIADVSLKPESIKGDFAKRQSFHKASSQHGSLERELSNQLGPLKSDISDQHEPLKRDISDSDQSLKSDLSDPHGSHSAAVRIEAARADLAGKLEAVFDDTDANELLTASRHPSLTRLLPPLRTVHRLTPQQAAAGDFAGFVRRGEPVVIAGLFGEIAANPVAHKWTLDYLHRAISGEAKRSKRSPPTPYIPKRGEVLLNVATDVEGKCCAYYEPRRASIAAGYPYPFQPTTRLYRDGFGGFVETMRVAGLAAARKAVRAAAQQGRDGGRGGREGSAVKAGGETAKEGCAELDGQLARNGEKVMGDVKQAEQARDGAQSGKREKSAKADESTISSGEDEGGGTLHYLHDEVLQGGVPKLGGRDAPSLLASDLEATLASLESLTKAWPDFSGFTSAKLWLGQRGIVMPLHYDATDNLYMMAYGRKRVYLAAPDQILNLYRYPNSHPLVGSSQVNLSQPNISLYPRFTRASLLEAVLGPSDALFLPAWWWHQFEQPFEATASLNLWTKAPSLSSPSSSSPSSPVEDDERLFPLTLHDHLEGVAAKLFGKRHGVVLAGLADRILKRPSDEIHGEEEQAHTALLEGAEQWKRWATSTAASLQTKKRRPGSRWDGFAKFVKRPAVILVSEYLSLQFREVFRRGAVWKGWRPGIEWNVSRAAPLRPRHLVDRCRDTPAQMQASFTSICDVGRGASK